jgi:NADPH:quinone reductase-like Zn-dependent oxidoreductase
VVGVTALQMIETHAEVRTGQRVIIHGAGGAVGSLAVQIALRQGAHVIGTEVASALDYVRSLGVAEAIESSTHFESMVAPVDAVIDTVGGDLQTRSFAVLKPGGVLVSSVSKPDPSSSAQAGVRGMFMLVDVTARALDRLRELVDAGALTTRLGAVLPLAEARRAHEMLEGLVERQPGKIVLLGSQALVARPC